MNLLLKKHKKKCVAAMGHHTLVTFTHNFFNEFLQFLKADFIFIDNY